MGVSSGVIGCAITAVLLYILREDTDEDTYTGCVTVIDRRSCHFD